jgi:hypothetical protein
MGRTTSTRGSRTTKISTSKEYSLNEETGEVEAEGQVDIEVGRRNSTPPRRSPGGGIDLGKGLDVEKPRPPRSPLGIEVGKSPQGNLGIGVEVPIGLSPFGARGGVSIDPATGKIRGGYGGLGVGKGPIRGAIDVGVDTPPGSEEFGCFRYITVTLGPFSHTYGKDECTPKSSPTPPGFTLPAAGSLVSDATKSCKGGTYVLGSASRFYSSVTGSNRTGNWTLRFKEAIDNDLASWIYFAGYNSATDEAHANNYLGVGRWQTITLDRQENYRKGGWTWQSETYQGGNLPQAGNTGIDYQGTVLLTRSWQFKLYYPKPWEGDPFTSSRWFTGGAYNYKVVVVSMNPPPPCPHGEAPQKSFSPPLPNPPPKKMDNDCCKQIALLLLMQHKHLGVQPIAGMENLQDWGVKQKGVAFAGEQMAFPFEVPAVWLNPTAKRSEKMLIKNVSELLLVIGTQNERLENFIGTKEFLKDSELKLRSSEAGILTWLKNKVTGQAGDSFKYPDPNDYYFNTDDGIINEKEVEVRSLADATRYLVESQNRLERILPIAELKDSSIPARWVYPGKKGQLRVGNLIHLIEYMFRADDRARGYLPIKIKVKDANPAVKGDQPVYLEFQSQADLLREMFKFIIDVEGDGDQSNNFLLRLAMQSCQNHQLNVQNNAMLDAIVEYLDFKVERKPTKVPMPFSPFAGKEPNLLDKLLDKLGFKYQPIPGKIDKNTEEEIESLFEGILQNTEVKVPIIQIPPGDKKYLSEALMEILKHASAASAAVSERVGDGALKRMIESAGIAQAVSRFLLKKDIAESNGVGDLDQWINSAELGYTDKPESQSLRFPESDLLEPYDRPANENPLIREVDTKDPKAD